MEGRPTPPAAVDIRTIGALAWLASELHPRWIVWRYTWNEKRQKWDKPPLTIRARNARSDDPKTWVDFPTAWHAVQRRMFDGPGLMLQGLPGEFLAAIDLDDVRDPQTGALLPWAQELVERSRSYVEITPSGTGLRILGTAERIVSAHTRIQHPEGGGFELYVNCNRYITVSGNSVGADRLADIADLIDELAALKPKPANGAANGHAGPISFQSLPYLLQDIVVRGIGADGKPIDHRGSECFRVVKYLKACGHTAADITAFLAIYPAGIAGKFAGRLAQEVERAYGKPFGEPTPEPPPGPSNWTQDAQRSRQGALINNLHNCLRALRLDPAWTAAFRYNQMAYAVVHPDQPIEDIDTERVHEWMQANGLGRIALETVREAIDLVGHEHPYHPIRDWLDTLEWDGVQRLGRWVHTYLGAEDTAYHAEIGQKFLIAMVARVMKPGCKSDYMPVLEGPQRALKSSACRVLAGELYFSDNLPDLGGDYVRIAMHLRGMWLIEISELSAFDRADSAKLKQFLSSAVEQYTPKFAHSPVREPRQCLFIGTTNDKHYLRDPTGGSRYWPITCGCIDLPALEAARNQLFAEALAHYNLGTPWWPAPAFEADIIRPIQDARFEADPWDEDILAYLVGVRRTTIAEVAEKALGMQKSYLKTLETRRIANLLRSAGWEQHKSTGGAREWRPPSKR